MREFVSYVLESFREATGWSHDNGYSNLNETASELLNFQTPRGLRMTLSSLATPQFATSYNLGSLGLVDGSIAYLYSSVPLSQVAARSDSIPLPALFRSYRQLHNGLPPFLAPTLPPPASSADILASLGLSGSAPPSPSPSLLSTAPTISLANAFLSPAAEHLAQLAGQARSLVDKPVLLYGRLYLPRSMLEAYMVKRLASSVQLQLRAVSDAKLPNGGTALGILQYDRGKYGIEGLASSDGGLLGVRGLYNFGTEVPEAATGSLVQPDSSSKSSVDNAVNGSNGGSNGQQQRLQDGRFSAGGEVYYGTLNKSGGFSLGARFATLPGQSGTPLMATMTINPLMGNISATYAVLAREYCSLATKFEFNVYSYESEWVVGMELWSKRRLAGLVAVDNIHDDDKGASASAAIFADSKSTYVPKYRERSFQAKLEWRLDHPIAPPETDASGNGQEKGSHANVDVDGKRAGQSIGNYNGNGNGNGSGSNIRSNESSSNENGSTDGAEKTLDRQYQGVLKARLDQNLKVGLLWEGRIKSLLFSLGSNVDLNRLDQPFRTLGLEIQYSS